MRNKLKKLLLIATFCFVGTALFACPACEKQQPKFLKGITHGTGPEGSQDYLIIGVAVIIVLLTFYYSVKWLIKPGEHANNHIKQFILNVD